ncbi:amidase [Nonomuraea sp. NPDC050404]|uniref:amidase n=1 Tax=Nonomuraea sp. NPDC050404 TaxID=3155783 RepID=UPI0033D1AD1B
MNIDPFIDATAQAALVREGQVTPLELVEAAIERIERLDPQLNSVVVPLFDKARKEAAGAQDGPFRGVPYLLKDLGPTSAGDTYSAGSAGMRAAGYRASGDSYFVQRMRAAGFVLVGKTNVPELGLAATTQPAAWGACRNPWDTGRTTGGSSGGSAAAVAAGLVAVAHGNDGSGSIRNPAAQCGVVGLKPSRGRVSQGPPARGLDATMGGLVADHCLTRSVRDTAAVLDVVSGRRPGDWFAAPTPQRPFAQEVGIDPGRLRIGVLTDGAGVEQAEVTRRVADVLADLGHHVADGHPARLRELAGEVILPVVLTALAAEAEHLETLAGGPVELEPVTRMLLEYAKGITGAGLSAAMGTLREVAGDVERWWEEDGWDLLLTPASGVGQPLLEEMAATPEQPFPPLSDPLTRFLMPFNATGQPAISLPLGTTSDGLPVGVQLVAAYAREDLLLRVSAQLEAALPWAGRHPAGMS